IGAANVVIVPLVKAWFSGRLALWTSLYLLLMQTGQFVAPLLAVPVAEATSWRFSVGIRAGRRGRAQGPSPPTGGAGPDVPARVKERGGREPRQRTVHGPVPAPSGPMTGPRGRGFGQPRRRVTSADQREV
ncbi:hypothetical protein ACWGL3_30110, partial [Nocardiopsis sp. NPDC055824]